MTRQKSTNLVKSDDIASLDITWRGIAGPAVNDDICQDRPVNLLQTAAVGKFWDGPEKSSWSLTEMAEKGQSKCEQTKRTKAQRLRKKWSEQPDQIKDDN